MLGDGPLFDRDRLDSDMVPATHGERDYVPPRAAKDLE